MPDKITKEIAQAEVESWLDKKKILPSTKELYSDYVDTMIDAVCEGILVLDPTTFVWKHKLMFNDLGGEETFLELSYRVRMNDKLMQPHMKGVKQGDADGRLNALVAALTDQPKGIIASLDTQDKKIAMSIAIFFL